MATMEAYSAELQKMLFSDGLKKLRGDRWLKHIDLKGVYVEK